MEDCENYRSEAEVGEALTEALKAALEEEWSTVLDQDEVKDFRSMRESDLLTDSEGFVLYLENGQRFQVSVKEF